MDGRRRSRVRTFLALGSALVLLSVAFLLVVVSSADGAPFLPFLVLPPLAFGGGLVGAGIADRETDGIRRPLRMGLAFVGANVGWSLYPLVWGSITGIDVLASIEIFVSMGAYLAAIAVVAIELLVWENRGRPG